MKALRCVVEESGQMLTNINGLDRKTKLFHVERIVHVSVTNIYRYILLYTIDW